MAPPRKKNSTFFDPQISTQDRLAAFQRLTPQSQQLLKSAGYKPGDIPTELQMDSVMAGVEDEARKALRKACSNALVRRDLASVDNILAALKKADILGLGDREEVDAKLIYISSSVMRMILQELELKAFRAFRVLPSSANYIKCRAAFKALEVVGYEDLPGYPVNPWPKCKISPPMKEGPYVVVPGDTLSKIAKRYYGEENLWDAIYESNGYEGDPDRIYPGQRLTIYAG